MGSLPYQVGATLSAIAEASTTELCTGNSTVSCGHSQEVFFIPDVNEDVKQLGNISTDVKSVAGETEAKKARRVKKNKQHQQRRYCAQRRWEAQERYDTEWCNRDEDRELECHRRDILNSSTTGNLKSEFEMVGGHKVYNTPEANIMYVAQALRNDPNLTLEQERLKVMLETTTMMMRGWQAPSQAGSTRRRIASSKGPKPGAPGNDNQNRGDISYNQVNQYIRTTCAKSSIVVIFVND